MSRSYRHSPHMWMRDAAFHKLGNRSFRRRNNEVLHIAELDDTPEFHDMRSLKAWRNCDSNYNSLQEGPEHRRCFWSGEPCDMGGGIFSRCPVATWNDRIKLWYERMWRK